MSKKIFFSGLLALLVIAIVSGILALNDVEWSKPVAASMAIFFWGFFITVGWRALFDFFDWLSDLRAKKGKSQ